MSKSSKYFTDYVRFVETVLKKQSNDIDKIVRERKKLIHSIIENHPDYTKYVEYYGQPLINPDIKLPDSSHVIKIGSKYFNHTTPVVGPSKYILNYPVPLSCTKDYLSEEYRDKDTGVETKILNPRECTKWNINDEIKVKDWMYDLLLQDAEEYLGMAKNDWEPESAITETLYEDFINRLAKE